MIDKYVIYKLKNKKVKALIPKRLGDFVIDGLIKDIKRDILNSKIIIKIADKEFSLKEPKEIYKKQNIVYFVYGNPNKAEITDDDILEKIRDGKMLDEILRSEEESAWTIAFEIQNK